MEDQGTHEMVPRTDIRYVGMGQLIVYLVSDDELRMMESGGPSSTYLNLAIFFLSVGLSFLASLIFSDAKSIQRFIVVVVILVACLTAGLVLLTLWFRSSKDATRTIARIRARLTPPLEGGIIQERKER